MADGADNPGYGVLAMNAPKGKAEQGAEISSRRFVVGDQPASTAPDPFLAWAMEPSPPLTGPMSIEQALGGLKRLQAWVTWACLELDRGDGECATSLQRQIAGMNAVLENIRPHDAKSPQAAKQTEEDLRWSLVEFAEAAARSVIDEDEEGATETAFGMFVYRAREIAPHLAARLDASAATARAAVKLLLKNSKRSHAILQLANVLGADYSLKHRSASRDANRQFREWQKRRRSGVGNTIPG